MKLCPFFWTRSLVCSYSFMTDVSGSELPIPEASGRIRPAETRRGSGADQFSFLPTIRSEASLARPEIRRSKIEPSSDTPVFYRLHCHWGVSRRRDRPGMVLIPRGDSPMLSTKKLSDVQLWQRNLASLIRSGLFLRADLGESNGLRTIVGIYGDGSSSAPMAKYADLRRAEDALEIINRLVESGQAAEVN